MQKLSGFHRVVANIAGLFVIALVLIIVFDSAGRFFFNKPLQGATEISRIMLAWILFGAITWALVRKIHIRVDFFADKFPMKMQLTVEIIYCLVSIGFFILALWAGWHQFLESLLTAETMPAPIWIPAWAGKLAVPVGCFIIAAQLVVNLFAMIRSMAGRHIAARSST